MINKKKKSIPISVEQSKLLGNTLRIKIISVLQETAKTSKQVATEIGESPGNVHYHIQKLYNGKLIDLVEEKPVGGVIEKYYLARSSSFESPEGIYPELKPGFNAASSVSSSSALYLNEEDKEKLLEEFTDLIKKWVVKTSKAGYSGTEEYVIGVNFVSRREKTEEEK
ncbi:winged helix-turn-helix domain-containing protein [Pseudogracilibacillus sp. SE30717A]|uniref:ArsR/SmtB family transcription factor n=1 Tax=Pseudogracilibacillus sp. SE30717A TaxID=3098293 RepID=UPI00300DE974